MSDIIDMSEMNELLSILEEMEDEQLAAKLLKELNDRTKELGGLIMNRDPNIQHGEWKAKSDEAKRVVDDVVKRIKSFKK